MGVPTEFLDINKNKSSRKNPIERSDIKFIENQFDQKICTEIDKLNENVYNLNNFLQLTKDIGTMMKDNLVKNDIQRKLNLKSQWLSKKFSSTGSLNSSSAIKSKKVRTRINFDKNDDRSSSAECLRKIDISEADGCSKKEFKLKSASIQSIVPNNRKTLRSFKSYDELKYEIKPTMRTDVDMAENVDHKKSQTVDFTRKDTPKTSQKLIEVKNTIDKAKNAQSKYIEPKSSTDVAKRDLSRFFPPKNESTPSLKVLKNPKRLKDIDISKYFLPKSISSPGQSPLPIRKTLSKVQVQPDRTESRSLDVQKSEPISHDRTESRSLEVHESEHISHIHCLDVSQSVISQVPKKNARDEPEKRLSDKINEIACNSVTGGDYNQLVNCLETPTESIDEMFEEVAATLIYHKKTEDEMEKELISKTENPSAISNLNSRPACKWHKKPLSLDITLDNGILPKLSINLLKEIDKLQKHLQIDQIMVLENQDKPIKDKLPGNTKDTFEHESCPKNMPSDFAPYSSLQESSLDLRDKASPDKWIKRYTVNSTVFDENSMKEVISKNGDACAKNHCHSNTNHPEMGKCSEKHTSVYDQEPGQSIVKVKPCCPSDTTGEPNSSDFTIENKMKCDSSEDDSHELQIPKLSSQQYLRHTILTSNPISYTSIAENEFESPIHIKTNPKEAGSTPTNIQSDYEIPSETTAKRQECLLKCVFQVENLSPIVKILEDDGIDKKSRAPKENSLTQEYLKNTAENSRESQLFGANNHYLFNDARSVELVNNNTEPLCEKRNDPTESLIKRSQSIHNKKEEFMNEKLFGDNPYMKNSVQDFEHYMDDKKNANQRESVSSIVRPTPDMSGEKYNTKRDADQKKKEKSKKMHSLNTTTPSTTNLNLIDLFKRNSTNNEQVHNEKDGCIIS